jgi:hypothetical protein
VTSSPSRLPPPQAPRIRVKSKKLTNNGFFIFPLCVYVRMLKIRNF